MSSEDKTRRPGVAKLRTSAGSVVKLLTPALGPREATSVARRLREDLSGDPDELAEAIDRILAGEPVQYVTCVADFYGLQLQVTPAVLIPRPETEELVEWILSDHPHGTLRNVLDIGTGSGCIPLALKTKRPDWTCTGMDVSRDAAAIAAENADMLGLPVKIMLGDIFEEPGIKERYSLVVSNPPYIPPSERAKMSATTLAHEPALALFVPQEDPLLFYRRIAEVGRDIMTDRGKLYLETNEHNNAAVVELLENHGYTDIIPRQDMQGKWRTVRATRPPAPPPTPG